MAKSKNNVKINLGTINETSMKKLSAFHVAIMELRSLRETKKSDIDKVEQEISELKEKRAKALDNGETIDTVAVKYDILPLTNKINAINEQFKKDCEPHNKSKKSALELIPNEVYYAYLLTMEKGSASAKGKVVTKTDKNGKAKEVVDVTKTLSQLIKDFAQEIGLGNADNTSAIDKFAMAMALRTNGMIKASKGDDYVKVKSASQYNELFMLTFLQYAINEKKVVVVNDDATLSVRDFTK